jgi:putative Ca2+/H+ antiporter (TMEM165/GDT1 family)
MDVFLPFLLAFGSVILFELGDKTQLMTISFASRYSKKTVFLGSWLGLGLVTVIGVVVGVLLGAAFDDFWIKIIAAAIFIAFGVWTLVKREEQEVRKDIPEKQVFLQTFIILVLAELGDKTQVIIIMLTANYQAPLSVLLGALLGFAVVVAVGVLIGKEIGKRVATKWIVLVSGILFIVIGVIVAIEAFLSVG